MSAKEESSIRVEITKELGIEELPGRNSVNIMGQDLIVDTGGLAVHSGSVMQLRGADEPLREMDSDGDLLETTTCRGTTRCLETRETR